MLKRKNITPRNEWKKKVEDLGMYYHTIDGKQYWNESNCYELTTKLVDQIDDATTELHNMCMEYVRKTIKWGDYDLAYGFDHNTIQLIENSFNYGHPSIYGRFDLGIDKKGRIKMFEYNADTPTGLLEASVVQWNWLQDYDEDKDQFNSIHEKLIAFWKRNTINGINKVWFTGSRDAAYEDWGNVHYILETASEAGLDTCSIDLEQVGWNSERKEFVDLNENNISTMFKLYPWEWMKRESFYEHIPNSLTKFIEPPWKMLLSNKLLCVKLWEMFPNHPLLLESHLKEPKRKWFFNKKYVKKPMLGREGQGVVIGGRDTSDSIAQEYFETISFGKIKPVIGSWVIDGASAGIGIREDIGITTNNSSFVPHYFVK